MTTPRVTSVRNRDSDIDGRHDAATVAPPRILVRQSLRSAQRQLLNAREDLKAARRRVVELERVVDQWHDLAIGLDRSERSGNHGTGMTKRSVQTARR